MPAGHLPELIAFLGWAIAEPLRDFIAARALADEPEPMARAIERAIESWRAERPRPPIQTVTLERQLLPSNGSEAAAQQRLGELLARGSLPSAGDWFALLAAAMDDLQRDRGADAHASFLDDPELEVHLKELASAIARSAAQEPALVLPELLERSPRPARQRTVAVEVALILREQLDVSDRHRELAGRAVRYVPREVAERAVRGAVEDGRPWTSILGVAGSGKSTLLHHLHRMWVDEALGGAKLVPIFADAQHLVGDVAESTIGGLAHELRLTARSAVDLLAQLGERLRDDGRRLLVLVDTLDAALLSHDGAHRLVRWIDKEAARQGIQVVTTCRPLEANRLRRAVAREVTLDDYTVREVETAIEHYLDAYHGETSELARGTFVARLRGLLASDMTSVLCRRPVTLRMIFEAYAADNIPEKLNRSRLFRDFWDRRVASDPVEQGVTRPRRSAAGEREQLVLAVADATRRSTARTYLADAHALALSVGRRDALDDLLSERVIVAEHRRVEFFHQSLLEHASARALIAAYVRGDSTGLEAELAAPLPWYALLEETAVLSAGMPSPSPAEIVLSSLIRRASAESLVAVASAWVQLEDDRGLEMVADTIVGHALMRSTCLDQIHNASRARLPAIMDTIGAAAWSSGATGERRAVLRVLAKVMPIAPDVVLGFVAAHLANDEGLASAIDTDNGHLARPLFEVFAGLLTVDETRAAALLESAWRVASARPQSLMAVSLVESVVDRAAASPAAVGLIWRWFQRDDASPYNSVKRHAAFAAAVASWAPPQAAGTWLDHAGMLRARWLNVLRLRLERGLEALDAAVGPRFESTDDHELIMRMFEAVFSSRLGAAHADALALLLRVACRPTPTSADAVRRKLALRALHQWLPDDDDERTIAAALGDALVEGQTADEIMLAVAVSPHLATAVDRRLQIRCGVDAEVATAVARAWSATRPTWGTAIVVVPWLARRLSKAHAIALSTAAPLLSGRSVDATRAALRASLRAWFEDERSGRALRLAAFRGLTAMASEAEPLPEDMVVLALTAWRRATDFGLGGQIGAALAKAIERGAIVGEARGQALTFAEGIVYARPDQRRATLQHIESRRVALTMLVAGHAERPSVLAERLERWLDGAKTGEVTTEELAEVATGSYRVANADPLRAWRIALRILRAAEQVLNNWNGVAPRLRGTIGAALAEPEARAEMLLALPTLPDYPQSEVIRVALNRHDEEFAAAIEPIETALGSRASRLWTWWRRRLPPGSVSRDDDPPVDDDPT